MNRRTLTVAVAASLPAGGLIALVANGNRAAEMISVVAVGAAAASVGWYGPRMALELRQDTVMRGRHRRAAGTAERPRTAAAEPDRGPDEDDLERTGEQPVPAEELPPSQRHAGQAGAGDGHMETRPRTVRTRAEQEQLDDIYIEQALGATQQIPRVDPYLYPAPDAASRFDLEVTEQDRTLAAIHDDLSARGVWNAPVPS